MSRKFKTYLAGSMQYAENLGADWRLKLTPILDKLGVKVYDPVKLEGEKLKNVNIHTLPAKCIDRITGKEFKPEYWHDLMRSEKPAHVERCQRIMSMIKKFDLDIVAKMDFLIVYWDETARKGSGTRSEIELAHKLGIPVYVVEEVPISAWTGQAVTKFFRNMDDLIGFLEEEFAG